MRWRIVGPAAPVSDELHGAPTCLVPQRSVEAAGQGDLSQGAADSSTASFALFAWIGRPAALANRVGPWVRKSLRRSGN